MTTNADYHADPAISASHLKAVMQSPYHYWSRFLDPQRPTAEPTSAMRLGSLAHCAVLEPDELSKRYAIAPDRRSNAGKAAAAEKRAYIQAEWDTAVRKGREEIEKKTASARKAMGVRKNEANPPSINSMISQWDFEMNVELYAQRMSK